MDGRGEVKRETGSQDRHVGGFSIGGRAGLIGE